MGDRGCGTLVCLATDSYLSALNIDMSVHEASREIFFIQTVQKEGLDHNQHAPRSIQKSPFLYSLGIFSCTAAQPIVEETSNQVLKTNTLYTDSILL